VVKYHRTLSTLFNQLIGAGFDLRRVEEPGPPPEMIARDPSARDEDRRPMFLLVAARKPDALQPQSSRGGG
jgi:hypothetical protein